MKRLVLVLVGWPCSLHECPSEFFLFNPEQCSRRPIADGLSH